VTVLTITCILNSGKWGMDFLGPQTDLLISFIGVIVGLILALITSRMSLGQKRSTAFWDIIFDMISISLHLLGIFFWKYLKLPIMNAQEKSIISVLLIAMTIIAFLEFVLTARNVILKN
jgi:hypothetical protein